MNRSVHSLLSVALVWSLSACGDEPPPAAEAPSDTAMSSGGETSAPASVSSIDEFVDPDRERARTRPSEAEQAEPAYDEDGEGYGDEDEYERDEYEGDDEDEDDEDA
ncbi:MAG: hypothetical protein PVI30_23350 [Myxococcales bacterium]|jgi:hypothetical protein